jgi:hypothetical protein
MKVSAQLRALVAACLLAGALAGVVVAQPMAIVAVAFRNELKTPVIVQGTSSVNGMIRRGPPILVAAGRVSGDFNVPLGPRLYSVYDANQPSRVLARDVQVNVLPGRNITFGIRPIGNQVGLVPE